VDAAQDSLAGSHNLGKVHSDVSDECATSFKQHIFLKVQVHMIFL
jgi:hypothetical protein